MPSPSRRAVVVPALVGIITSAALQQPSLPRNPSGVILAAEQAMATHRAAAVRQDWLARLRRDPSNRLARLGVASFARLAYDYAAADSFVAPLLARPGSRPDSVAAWARIETALAAGQQWLARDADSLLSIAVAEARVAGYATAEGGALTRLALIRGRTHGVDAGLALLDSATRVLPASDVPGRALALAYRAQLLLARGTPGAGPLADSALRLARRSNS